MGEYIIHAYLFFASDRLIAETFSGADGSRSIQKVEVDATGTGTNFVPAKMVVNGDAVHTVRRIPYPRTHLRLVESYGCCHTKAHRSAPCRYQMHWWH